MLSASTLLAPQLGRPWLHSVPRTGPAERGFTLQKGEFDMAWHSVWSTYFEDDEEHDDFLNWFLENACPRPLDIAVEEVPYGLLVCAKKCKEGWVPVLKHSSNGTRVRKCRRLRRLDYW